MEFRRAQAQTLNGRLKESPRTLTIIAGPRQVGKSTLVRQVLGSFHSHYAAADQAPDNSVPLVGGPLGDISSLPGSPPTADWLIRQWEIARARARQMPADRYFVLAIDEVQKVPRWSDVVKGLWDADRMQGLNLHVVLLGSAPLLMQEGLAESLAGRFELISLTHWSYTEMRDAFDFSLEEYIYFGGYPGTATFRYEETRWREYVRDALVSPNIQKDILQMTRVDKPALLRSLFELGCHYSGQIISYTKLVGQLQDAGNTTTLAHYLQLLARAGLLTGLTKFAGQKHRQRASSPKLHVLNTALISAQGDYTFDAARADRSYWGRLVESSVGAHLCNSAEPELQVQYWREGAHEVDFILSRGKRQVALEVKSGQGAIKTTGMAIFQRKYPEATGRIVGSGGIPLDEFLTQPASHWLEE